MLKEFDINNLPSVSVEGLTEIGRGMTSRVYRLDRERVIKVFYPGILPEEIENERKTSRMAFIKDIPTAITYQMVRVGGNYGIIYELIDAVTLAETVHEHPEELDAYARKAAALLKKLHKTTYEKGEMPDTRQVWIHLHELGLCNYLTDGENRTISSFLNKIPEQNTFIHGDYHPMNVMVRDGELILIDVGGASLGDPFFDLASIYMACILLPPLASEKRQKELIMSIPEWEQFWRAFIPAYLKTDDDKAIREAEKKIRHFAILRQCMTHALIPGRSDEERRAYIRPKIENFFQEVQEDYS